MDFQIAGWYDAGMEFGGTFEGGLNLPICRERTRAAVPRLADLPERLTVPLCVDGKRTAKCVVTHGTQISAGDVLGEFADGGIIAAPANGTVGEPTRAEICVGRDALEVDAVELLDLAWPDPAESDSPELDLDSVSADDITERLSCAGLFVRGDRVTELGRWIRHLRKSNATRLVVSLIEDEPYSSSRHAVAAHCAESVSCGAMAIAKACGMESVEVLVDGAEMKAYDDLATMDGITHTAVDVVFPLASKRLLKKLAGDSIAILDGIVAMQAWELLCGRLSWRGSVVTIAGPNQNSPDVLFVPDGMALRDVVGDAQGPMIAGGAMRGQLAREASVSSAGMELICSMDPPRSESMGACIRCGWCRDHCPARLNVALLNDCFELGRIEVAQHYGVERCLACGACSYVCPSRLALRERMSELAEAARRLRRAIAKGEQ